MFQSILKVKINLPTSSLSSLLSSSFSSINNTKKKVVLSKNINQTFRLERIISNRSDMSRKKVSKLFKKGLISINDEIIKNGAIKMHTNITGIKIDGVLLNEIPLLSIYHKPINVQSTMGDNYDRSNLNQLLSRYDYLNHMHPVGRLDADTSGLLLFSSNGHLTQTLLHPNSNIEREYEAIVAGIVDYEELKEILNNGVKTTEGIFPAKLIESKNLNQIVSVVIPKRVQKHLDINNNNENNEENNEENEEENEYSTETVQVETSFIRLVVTEGKYRMVRRILHNAGHSVLQLHRIRYGDILLNDIKENTVKICDDKDHNFARSIMKKIK